VTKDSVTRGRKHKTMVGVPHEYVIVRKDGSQLIVEVISNYINYKGKKSRIATVRDINEKKKSEELLIEEKEKAEKYLNLSGVMIVSLDLKGRVIMINKKGNDILGYKDNYLVGKDWFKTCLPKSITESVGNVFRDLVKGRVKLVEHYENLVITKNGEERLIGWYNTILKDNKNKVIGILSSGQDITERKKIEKSLVESEEKHRLIYETSSDAIMTLEPPSWVFTSGNSAIVKMFGVKNEKEFTSLGPWDVSPKYQPDGQLSSVKAKKMIGIAMKKGTNFFEWTHKKVRGGDFFATVLLNRVKMDEKVFLQARVSDITERKNAEEKLKKKTNDLQRLNRAMIGRESRMIELKEKIRKAKTRKNEN
jgi:PAS domain S-box-containing protein